uniref:Uncharacterized protein n=1 Tax=Opuntia streptacantha TaxID=393608 RepID=A0A7C9CP10_OPUST
MVCMSYGHPHNSLGSKEPLPSQFGDPDEAETMVKAETMVEPTPCVIQKMSIHPKPLALYPLRRPTYQQPVQFDQKFQSVKELHLVYQNQKTLNLGLSWKLVQQLLL